MGQLSEDRSEAILARKKWKKFGLSQSDPPGPSTATTSEIQDEIEIRFLLNSAYEHIGDALDLEQPGEEKELYRPTRRAAKQASEGGEEVKTDQDSKTEGGEEVYRAKRPTRKSEPPPPQDEEVTLRVTNIMEFTAGREDSLEMQDEIRQLFETIRPPKEVEEEKPPEKRDDKSKKEEKRAPPPIRVKLPLHESGEREGKPRGFAFVTLWGKKEAEQAIAQLDKRRLRGMVIRVELAKPRGDARSDKK